MKKAKSPSKQKPTPTEVYSSGLIWDFLYQTCPRIKLASQMVFQIDFQTVFLTYWIGPQPQLRCSLAFVALEMVPFAIVHFLFLTKVLTGNLNWGCDPEKAFSIISLSPYRVTQHIGSNLQLTSKHKFRFDLACPDLARPKPKFCVDINGRFEPTLLYHPVVSSSDRTSEYCQFDVP